MTEPDDEENWIHIGSSLDDLLKEDGTFEEVEEVALKRVRDWTAENEEETLDEILEYLLEKNKELYKRLAEDD